MLVHQPELIKSNLRVRKSVYSQECVKLTQGELFSMLELFSNSPAWADENQLKWQKVRFFFVSEMWLKLTQGEIFSMFVLRVCFKLFNAEWLLLDFYQVEILNVCKICKGFKNCIFTLSYL